MYAATVHLDAECGANATFWRVTFFRRREASVQSCVKGLPTLWRGRETPLTAAISVHPLLRLLYSVLCPLLYVVKDAKEMMWCCRID